MQPDQDYHDPFSEAGRAGLEKLMAFGVLTEAGGRYAAERTRLRLAREEGAAEHEHAAAKAQEKADRLTRAQQARQERQWRTLVADDRRLAEHMGGLPVQEVARYWSQGAGRAGQDPPAAAVLVAAETELRVRLPTLMDRYDRARKAGVDRFEAMRGAVADLFDDQRPHESVGKQGLPVLDRELEDELRRHAGQLQPPQRARWLRAMEARGWSPESVAWAEAMLARSEDQRRTAAVANAAAEDDPATPADERTDGLTAAATATGRADDLARDATAEAHASGRAFTKVGDGSAYDTRVIYEVEPARLAALSFATAPQAALRPALRSPQGTLRPPAPGRTARRGPAR